MGLNRGDTQLKTVVETSVRAFTGWVEKCGYATYDPYDLWGSAYGLEARRIYYKHSRLGLPLIAPILLMEIICPGWRRLWMSKQRYATADAQLGLAFLNLHQADGGKSHLERAKGLADDLIAYSIPGYSGHCWGYPFSWQHNRGMWPRNTPFITATPYCYEAFVRLYEITDQHTYLETGRSIARFVHKDLRDTPTGLDTAAGSYSPIDNSLVVNASAYRAMVLFDAGHRFNIPEYCDTARRNLNFVLQSQRADGAWLYAMNNPAENFIDHFHTCFVLKNLWKLNRWLRAQNVADSIARGYAYYRQHLFGPDDLPRSFAIRPRLQLARHEMYDFAEAITLGCLLRDDVPEAFVTARRLGEVVCRDFQLPDGHFVTRVYRGGLRHTLPFMRWPQAQLFLALTNCLLSLK